MKPNPIRFDVIHSTPGNSDDDNPYTILERGKPIGKAPTHQAAVSLAIERVYADIRFRKHGAEVAVS